MLSQWPLVRFCTAHLLFYKLVLVTTRLNEVGLVCGLNLEDRATRTIATRVLNFVLCSVPSTLSWILDFGFWTDIIGVTMQLWVIGSKPQWVQFLCHLVQLWILIIRDREIIRAKGHFVQEIWTQPGRVGTIQSTLSPMH
jgi:hypothetical protein